MERLPNKNLEKGLIIFSGINEYEEKILEIIKPELKIKMFYYNCGDKFIVDASREYLDYYK